jgi:hypothetical protein
VSLKEFTGQSPIERTNVLNLQDFGAVAGASIDAALTAAKLELGATGGQIFIPPGSYTFTDLPSFAETRNITLMGGGGVTAGATAATLLTYTGTGTRAIDARSSFGFKLQDLQLFYNQSGTILQDGYVDLSHSDGSGADAAYYVIDNVHISGSGVRGAQKLINLNDSITGLVRDCNLQHSRVAIYGKVSDSDYANSIRVENCTFLRQTFAHIANGGEAWHVASCTFEPLCDAAGTLTDAGAFKFETATLAKALTFTGCWFGDTTTGTWITFKGEGLSVVGNFLGGGAKAVSVESGSTSGVLIAGNAFVQNTSGVVVAGASNTGFTVLGNSFNTVVNRVTLTTTPTSSLIDPGTGAFTVLGSGTQALEIDGFIDMNRTGIGNGVLRAFVSGEANERVAVHNDSVRMGAGGGSAPDTVLSRAAAGVFNLDDGVQLNAVAAASVPNNSLFRDSADNIIKIKDNGGTVRTLY